MNHSNYYNMGSTETRHKDNLELDYRLIRRYISEFYSSEVTIIEHKHSKEMLAMREGIYQSCPEKLKTELETRKALTHQNLIQLRNYWIQTDLGMCSTMLRLQVLFEYHENTLEDILSDRSGAWEDAEIVDFIRQIFNALSFMERKGVTSLLAGPKNIAVAEKERSVDDSRTGRERGLSQLYEKQRNSLADLSRKHSRLYGFSQGISEKRIYKLFEPFEGIVASKSFINMQNYMQVPLHPQLMSRCQQHIIPNNLIKLQNMHTIAMLGASLAQGCDVFQLEIFKNNRFCPEKLRTVVQDLKESHPRSSAQINRLLNRGNGENELLLQPFKIKALPFLKKERQSSIEEYSYGGRVQRTFSRKRLSLLQAH